jgi:hypothetical protein
MALILWVLQNIVRSTTTALIFPLNFNFRLHWSICALLYPGTVAKSILGLVLLSSATRSSHTTFEKERKNLNKTEIE